MVKRILLIAAVALLFLSVGTKAQTQHFITLTWVAPAVAPASYNVYRATVSGGPYTKIINCPTVSINDTTGVAGTKYFYVVRSVDASGNESANSNEASATAIGNPSPPTSVSAVPH